MKSVTGLILGVVGSILTLTFSLIFFVFGILIFFGRRTMLEYNLSDKVLDFSSSLGIWLFVLAVWFLIFGFLGIWFSAMMNRPQKVVKGGIWILVCGILVLNLFMVIAGIMGILIGKKSGSTGGVGSSPIQQTKGSVVLRVLENNSVPGNLQNV